jgi:hypothetical protein
MICLGEVEMFKRKFRNYANIERIIESQKEKVYSDLLINVRASV